MTYLYNIALVFGVLFVICLLVTIILWFKFFPVEKRFDVNLYERIKFRWKFEIRKTYVSYIFKKEFLDTPDELIKRYANMLYYSGHIGQWGFNVHIFLMIIIIIFK